VSSPELKQQLIEKKDKVIFKLYIKKGCSYSERAMKLLNIKERDTIVFNPSTDQDYNIQKDQFRERHEDLRNNVSKDFTFPCVFNVSSKPPVFIGGYSDLKNYLERFF
jgi:glutaredoxin